MEHAGGRVARWLERLALARPEQRAWALYDWANSAFWLTVITVVFPKYYALLTRGVLGKEDAAFRYAMATSAALAVVAVVAPLLGTYADLHGLRKRFLGIFAAVGIAATAGLFFVLPGDWLLALFLFGIANFGVAGSVVFYDALLPHVARSDETDRLSTTGFALGYLGSGLLLLANLAWILRPEWFGLPSGDELTPAGATLPTRLAFLSVALWWGVFTLPLLVRVGEPPAAGVGLADLHRSALDLTLARLRQTLRELGHYRQAVRMLIAFLIFNDGIVTLIRMAVLYSDSRGLEQSVVMGSILLLQFVGVPFALLFGHLGGRFGPKRMVLGGLTVYSLICVLAFTMSANWHFVGLAVLVGTVQGGTQGLARSLFASMIPREKSGEFFAFFGVGEKFAGIFGPLLFGLTIRLFGDVQPAVLTLIAFFVVGGVLLLRVDVAEGRRQALVG